MGSNSSSSVCTLCLPMYAGCMNATVSIGYCISSQTHICWDASNMYISAIITSIQLYHFHHKSRAQNDVLFHSYYCFALSCDIM
jgi:hypothetical protein